MNDSATQCDLILAHVPAKSGSRYYVMQMAVGLPALAEHVRQSGYAVEVLHLGIERLQEQDFSLAEFVKSSGAVLVGFSVQWHWQLHDSLTEVDRLKAACPSVRVVVGGLTASFFAAEILQHYLSVDFVIRGDGEKPLTKLFDCLQGDGDLASVPNLAWRQDADVKINDLSYIATSDELRKLTFGVSNTMRHQDLYLRTGIEDDLDNPMFIAEPSSVLCGGRGCIHECSFCSGSRSSVQFMANRRIPSSLGPEVMSDVVRKCIDAGVRHFYLSADVGRREDEFAALFEHIRTSVGYIRMDIEAWTVPSKMFVKVFQECTDSRSVLVLSPTCASEVVRRANRSCFSTNDQYEDILAICDDMHVPVWLYFTMGLPFETMQDVQATLNWQACLAERFQCITAIKTQPQHLEPGSPMFLHPDKYNVRLLRRSLRDFVEASPLDGVGYETEHFSADEIASLCRDSTLHRPG